MADRNAPEIVIKKYNEDKYKELFEYAFNELKSDIKDIKTEFKEGLAELRQELKESNKEREKENKELRKDIFGNGDPGMCTQRQDILKTWVLRELGLLSKEIMTKVSNITKVPSRVYNIVWKVLAMIGMISSGIVFIFKYLEISVK